MSGPPIGASCERFNCNKLQLLKNFDRLHGVSVTSVECQAPTWQRRPRQHLARDPRWAAWPFGDVLQCDADALKASTLVGGYVMLQGNARRQATEFADSVLSVEPGSDANEASLAVEPEEGE